MYQYFLLFTLALTLAGTVLPSQGEDCYQPGLVPSQFMTCFQQQINTQAQQIENLQAQQIQNQQLQQIQSQQAQQIKSLQDQNAALKAQLDAHLVVIKPTRKPFEPEMLPLAAGCFQMSSPSTEAERGGNEQQRQVCVQEFAIGKYEVTFAEYDAFATATVRDMPADQGWGRDRRPVINVSWDDAVAYAQWLSQQTGKNYRLPTEAEWEYAARAGTSTAYWWGDTAGQNHANCGGCGSQWDNKQTAPVGSFAANPWGLYDTAGNVWEWTCSEYDSGYSSSKENTCHKQGNSGARAARGGAWGSEPDRVRAAFRGGVAPSYRDVGLGFRLVQD